MIFKTQFFLRLVLFCLVILFLESCANYSVYDLVKREPAERNMFINKSISSGKIVVLTDSFLYHINGIEIDSISNELILAYDSVANIQNSKDLKLKKRLNALELRAPNGRNINGRINHSSLYLFTDSAFQMDKSYIKVPYKNITFAAKWYANIFPTFLLIVFLIFLISIIALLNSIL